MLAVEGTYVEQRAVVAVQPAEAASESAADAAAKASYGVLTGSGHSTMGYMGMEYSRAQSSWEMCRGALGLSVLRLHHQHLMGPDLLGYLLGHDRKAREEYAPSDPRPFGSCGSKPSHSAR